ncbi:MAG: hypothetical protein KF894_08900 [Labilithrix sp.]|nr:hypothetical protein [Labilithrix sp.]
MAKPGRKPKPKPLPDAWPCPGVTVPPAPGAHGAWSASGTGGGGGPLPPAKLARLLRTFEGSRAVATMKPYANAADEWLTATTTQLTAALGDAGPAEMAILANAGLQLMWSRRLFDKAAKDEDVRLAESASRLAEAAGKNVKAAFELRASLRALRERPDARDPLAAYVQPLSDQPEPSRTDEEEQTP